MLCTVQWKHVQNTLHCSEHICARKFNTFVTCNVQQIDGRSATPPIGWTANGFHADLTFVPDGLTAELAAAHRIEVRATVMKRLVGDMHQLLTEAGGQYNVFRSHSA